MKIEVTAQRALCDEKVGISIVDAVPGSEIEVTARLAFPWAAHVTFQSHAVFVPGQDGKVNLDESKPVRGSYDYADSMGLIQSLRVVSGKLNDIIDMDIKQDLEIVLEARQGGAIASCTLARAFYTSGVKRRRLTGGLVGELFYRDEPGRSTVLVLGGSDGNLKALLPVASLLASRGFNALALSYFGQPGLPAKLEGIPLDYVKKALQELQNWPETKDNPVFVQGTSKGGEMALILASLCPEIKKVAAWAPHGYCFHGLANKNRSSWTLEGKPVPFIPLKNRFVAADIAKAFVTNTPFGYTNIFRKEIAAAGNREAARIKVEQGNSEYLLLAGTEDNIWNAHEGCCMVVERLKQADYPHHYEYVSYEGAGHPFYPPYIIPLTTNKLKTAPRFTFYTGGSLQANAVAQADMWRRTLSFFGES